MRLRTTYKQIFNISIPIMFGSAAQNIVALSDSIFLYHLSESDFAAIGFIGVFYLIIAAVGYGFSKGGQILIARRYGERDYEAIGNTFYALAWFEFFLAIVMFLIMQFAVPVVFKWFIDSPIIYEKSIQYLIPRSYGVFFSYIGVVILALYMGIAKPKFIFIDTAILAISNIALDYALIFGKWGFPQMGIAGAAWASTIAEVLGFSAFVIYMFFDKDLVPFHLNKLHRYSIALMKKIYKISTPIVGQAVLGMGSWFIFFSLIENLGERALATSNLIRITYLTLSIPAWGYSSAINTLVSNFIGARKRQAVWPIIAKTAKLSVANTLLVALPVCLLPTIVLYPFFGGEDLSLIRESKAIFLLLIGIMVLFSYGLIIFNGVLGTGASYLALKVQAIGVFIYLLYLYILINVFHGSVLLAWGSEIIYWTFTILVLRRYLKSDKWKHIKH